MLVLLSLSSAFAWYDSNYDYRQQINVTNLLSSDRTNTSMVFNVTSANVVNGVVLMVDSTDLAEYTKYNITAYGSGWATVRLYDSFNNGETKTFYAYFGNTTPVTLPSFKQSKYEKLWEWNEVNTSQITEVFDEFDCRTISKKDCEGTACIVITESGFDYFNGTGGTALWNISDLDTNQNYLDSFYMSFTSKWNGSDTANNGLPSQAYRMTDSGDSFYEVFSFTGDAGCGEGLYLRNRTSTSYQASIDCEPVAILQNTWYNQESYFMIPSNYTYGVAYNSSGSWVVDFQWGEAFDSRSVGFRYYSGDNIDADIVFIKDFEIGTVLTNRNVTTTFGEEEVLGGETTTTTSTTTLSETTTVTAQPSGIDTSLSDIGSGVGTILSALREPLVKIIMAIGMIGVVLFIFYALVHSLTKSVKSGNVA